MQTQLQCRDLQRREALSQAPLNGIDYLEVASVDQKTLKVFFVHNLPGQSNPVPAGPALNPGNVSIEGGVRERNIKVTDVSSSGRILTVVVNKRGDFSQYRLKIVTSPANDAPPVGFDSQLSAVTFSFKVNCPSEFDCRAETDCPPEPIAEPELNYLAKDYDSFRRTILDRLSTLMPGWRERSPADLQVTLAELLAYVGDHLSYYQDAVGTEAYLGTARRRVSVRRHARLLDYSVHDGVNARVWVSLEIEPGGDAEGQELPQHTLLATGAASAETVVPLAKSKDLLSSPRVVGFETLHATTLHSAHNLIHFHTWHDNECCLPAGSTRATLVDEPALSLQAGDVLLLEEIVSPTNGRAADADPLHRHAVRIKSIQNGIDLLTATPVLDIEWHEQDALPFPLCLTARISGDGGAPALTDVSVARGNVVLADHGVTVSDQKLIPERVSDSPYRPKLPDVDLGFGVPFAPADEDSASELIAQEPGQALPLISRLSDGPTEWQPRRDLLDSDRFASDFVTEVESDGTVQLRFGDDVFGKSPTSGTVFDLEYRIGNGPAGNVGTETINTVVSGLEDITVVRNPLPAVGGVAAETIEEIRQFAPQAFRTQERAVTEADYAEKASLHREVQQAVARFRWTGSWYTVFITVDRIGGRSVTGDPKFRDELLSMLDRYRLAGYDLELRDPIFVPLDLFMTVCVEPGYFRSDVKSGLLRAFSNADHEDGSQGFFHPDRFSFGQPVYLSRVYEAAMQVAGVASVDVTRFQRFGKVPNNELANGVLRPELLEIVRLDNDPSQPENGKIDFDVQGGL